MRQRVRTIEEDILAARLARLAESPRAAEWDWQSEQLVVFRALASNTRAVVQYAR
jgi:hypothetical protein